MWGRSGLLGGWLDWQWASRKAWHCSAVSKSGMPSRRKVAASSSRA